MEHQVWYMKNGNRRCAIFTSKAKADAFKLPEGAVRIKEPEGIYDKKPADVWAEAMDRKDNLYSTRQKIDDLFKIVMVLAESVQQNEIPSSEKLDFISEIKDKLKKEAEIDATAEKIIRKRKIPDDFNEEKHWK